MLDSVAGYRMRGPVLKAPALVLNRALSFDLCVCPPGAIAPYAESSMGALQASWRGWPWRAATQHRMWS
eukprot:2786232-Alexandrium_andersonii.AAC.1